MTFFRLRFNVAEYDTLANRTRKTSHALVACGICVYAYQTDHSVRDLVVAEVKGPWYEGCESPAHEGDPGKLARPTVVDHGRRTAVDEVLAWPKEEWERACRTGNPDIVLALHLLMGDILRERGIIQP